MKYIFLELYLIYRCVDLGLVCVDYCLVCTDVVWVSRFNCPITPF